MAVALVVVLVVVLVWVWQRSPDTPPGAQPPSSVPGGIPPTGLLGLEVIWTPADENDSMTETDVMTTYPELRSL